ncbi:MAG: hypothetical protein M3Q19_11945 [Pseudomonadota bacterium]|nr:hypothetical protein [Pseudomonadota bacterium]
MTDPLQFAETEAAPQIAPTSLLAISAGHYLSLAKCAKVISFDVFDTLLHRRVLLPRDIFGVVGLKIGIEDFAAQRFAAEARARRLVRPDTSEVCLDEIYEAFPKDFLPDRELVKQLELEVEREFTFANAAMRSTIGDLRAKGFRVVAITDTYLSKEQVETLLAANGIEVDAIYASSDHRHGNLGKYNGAIYPEVCGKEQVQPSELLHAGDHSDCDVANALSHGLVAVQANHPYAFLAANSEHFAAVIGEHESLTTSLIAGTIARSKLADRSRLATSLETYGYDFGGPLVVGLVAHIIARCQELGIDHLVLLARDGCVVGDVLDVLKPEGLTYRIMPSSRRLAVFPAFASGGLDKIKSLFAGQKRLSKRQILAVLRLEHLADGLADADEVMEVRTAITQMKPQLLEQAEIERAALLEYLEPEVAILQQGRMFAWVDVGWALSSPARLNELLGHDIPGFFVGSHGNANPSPGFEGYLFTRGKPHALARYAMRSVELFELIFADSAPSAAYLKRTSGGIETVHYDKSPAESVRDAHISTARSGVRQFAEDIRPVFDLLSSDDLRQYNRKIWKRLCTNPPAALYKLLSVVPHDALAGTMTWRTIGDLWLPNWSFDTPDRKAFPTARAYRIAFLRRYLKWHLPPSIWHLLRRIESVLRKYI